MHDHPSPSDYLHLAAVAAGTAACCWFIHREVQAMRADRSVAAPDAEAALRRINLRLIRSGN